MIYSDVRLEEVSQKQHHSLSSSNSGSYNSPEKDPLPASPQSNSDSSVISSVLFESKEYYGLLTILDIDYVTSELSPAEAVDQNQYDDLVTSAPLGTSLFSPNNIRLAINI